MYCTYGVIGSIDDMYYGVNPYAAHGACMSNENNEQCATTSDDIRTQLASLEGLSAGTV